MIVGLPKSQDILTIRGTVSVRRVLHLQFGQTTVTVALSQCVLTQVFVNKMFQSYIYSTTQVMHRIFYERHTFICIDQQRNLGK